jgi:NAD(P)-dependent dehydrogenase (short-subunit alcohol dehydrogenase family)
MKVLVTGANRGLGLEFCRQLLSGTLEVDEIVATARNPQESSALLELAAAHSGRLHLVSLDLSSDLDPKRSARGLADRVAGVASDRPFDLLINNAGVYLDEGKGVEGFDFEAFRQSFEVNTLGPFKVVKELFRQIRSGARIVQITSLMGSVADNRSGGSYAYRSSKAALNMMNRCFAIDRPDLVSVVMHPGWVQTDMGGQRAPLQAKESVAGMLGFTRTLRQEHSGRFYNYDGTELPW